MRAKIGQSRNQKLHRKIICMGPILFNHTNFIGKLLRILWHVPTIKDTVDLYNTVNLVRAANSREVL